MRSDVVDLPIETTLQGNYWVEGITDRSGIGDAVAIPLGLIRDDKVTCFATRAALVDAVDEGLVETDGQVVVAGGLHYKWQLGATAIADLPGLVPHLTWTAEHMGALVDGNSDDAPFIEAVLAAGRGVFGIPGTTYRLKSPVIASMAGTGIEGNGALYLMDTSVGAFDNDSYAGGGGTSAGRYSVTNTGGQKYAVAIRADDLDGVFVRRCRFTLSTWTDLLYLTVIYFENCTNLEVDRCEFYNFSRGKGVIKLNDCGTTDGDLLIPAGWITRCNIHNIWTEANSGSDQERQLTGIDVDASAQVGTFGLSIDDSDFYGIAPTWSSISGATITAGASGDAARLTAARNIQSDGIQFGGDATKPTRGCSVNNCRFSHMGEGIDNYGNDNNFTNNTFHYIMGIGIKIINGASFNLTQGNQLRHVGISGITLGGGAVEEVMNYNKVLANIIRYIGTAGDWQSGKAGTPCWDASEANAALWDAQTKAGVTIGFGQGAADTWNTLLAGNTIDGGGVTGVIGIRIEGEVGKSIDGSTPQPHIIRSNTIIDCDTDYSDNENYGRREESRGLLSLGNLSTTTGTTATLNDIPAHVRRLYFEIQSVSFEASGTLQLALSADGSTFGTPVAITTATGAGANSINGTVLVDAVQVAAQAAFATPRTYTNGGAFTTEARVSGGIQGPFISARFSEVGGAAFDAGTIRCWGELG